MTHPPANIYGLVSTEAILTRISGTLAARFAGIFSRETINRYVAESYTALRRTSQIPAYVPVLAELAPTTEETAP